MNDFFCFDFDVARIAFCIIFCLVVHNVHAATYYVTVAGLGGESDYEQRFTMAAKDLEKIFKDSGAASRVYTLIGDQATAIRFKQTLNAIASEAHSNDDFVLVLIGHGSFDGSEYKFNLVGPDITATEIAVMCNLIASRRQLIVDTTSASGAAAFVLERTGRAVVVATKSGAEKNATVFARYWVQALQDPSADTDKNDSISAMEAFVYATNKTSAFYDSQKRLATEHASFNDVGHGDLVRAPTNDQGLLMSTFTLLQFSSKFKTPIDVTKQGLLTKKEDIEQKIDLLKYQKAAMDSTNYKKQLTALLLELAKVQEALDK